MVASTTIVSSGKTIVVPLTGAATTTASESGSCATGWFSCAASLGGDCCPGGYTCGTASCSTAGATATGVIGKESLSAGDKIGYGDGLWKRLVALLVVVVVMVAQW